MEEQKEYEEINNFENDISKENVLVKIVNDRLLIWQKRIRFSLVPTNMDEAREFMCQNNHTWISTLKETANIGCEQCNVFASILPTHDLRTKILKRRKKLITKKESKKSKKSKRDIIKEDKTLESLQALYKAKTSLKKRTDEKNIDKISSINYYGYFNNLPDNDFKMINLIANSLNFNVSLLIYEFLLERINIYKLMNDMNHLIITRSEFIYYVHINPNKIKMKDVFNVFDTYCLIAYTHIYNITCYQLICFNGICKEIYDIKSCSIRKFKRKKLTFYRIDANGKRYNITIE